MCYRIIILNNNSEKIYSEKTIRAISPFCVPKIRRHSKGKSQDNRYAPIKVRTLFDF